MSTRRIWCTIGPLALALAAACTVSTAVSNYDDHPWIWGPVAVVSGLAFSISGLIAWTQRPENGTGRLLVLVGFVFLTLASLWEANNAVLASLGNALGALYLAVFLQIGRAHV